MFRIILQRSKLNVSSAWNLAPIIAGRPDCLLYFLTHAARCRLPLSGVAVKRLRGQRLCHLVGARHDLIQI
jgi:hypothetical protein